MREIFPKKLLSTGLMICAVSILNAGYPCLASVPPGPEGPASARPNAGPATATPDLSGRRRVGKASFYAGKFAGRTMANGTAMNPHANNAASKTLPLGTSARVTNLDTGKSAVVVIQDRGPFVKGRIIDLSASTATKIGLSPSRGVARVQVAPLTVPMPDGRIKHIARARDPTRERMQ